MIGVYDSGYGGLTVLRHIRRLLPERSTCYLGDSGRAPYGGRDVHTILDFAEQAVERLFDEGCHLVVVACHTVSCVGLRHLQQRYARPDSDCRVLGVAIPAAEIATRTSRGRIGLLATETTVASGTYMTEVAKLGSHTVVSRAAGLLAPLIEEGWEDTELARDALRRYLADLPDIDTLLLGCTHYPLLHAALADVVPSEITVLDPAPFVAERLADWLRRHPGFDTIAAPPVHRMLCTGDPSRFARHGRRFLGQPLPTVEAIAEVGGRLALRRSDRTPMGQIVR
ncbi:MAG: glutamate racemase [Deltaproteobacteria bacterium]|nr:glutamate racemase [Deltaproteobacteria bacterium]HCH61417.1 glutamate racemase [Deltaproteobacteria bacterium]